jgi:hypothetical protein
LAVSWLLPLILVVRAVGQAIDNFAKVFEIIGKVARFFGMDFEHRSWAKATKTVNNLNTGTVDAYKSFAEQSRTIKDRSYYQAF